MEESNLNGASAHERLLAAARSDNEDLLLEVFKEGKFDINCVDGLGNTPLHLAVAHGSTDILEHILSQEDCDVDPINRMAKTTPLHLAVQLEPVNLRHYIVTSLLEAGADTFMKDKNGDTAVGLIPSGDEKLQEIFRQFQKQASYSRDDVASDDEEAGSGSDEE